MTLSATNSARWLLIKSVVFAFSTLAQDMGHLAIDSPGVSPNCSKAIADVVMGDFGSCTKSMDLMKVFRAPKGFSAVPQFSNWVQEFCTYDPCSASSLSSTTDYLQSSCQPEIKNGSHATLGIYGLSSQYSSIREALCLKYTSNSTLCVPFVLKNYESFKNNFLTVSQIITIFSGGFSTLMSNLEDVPPQGFCNDCVHGLLTLLPSVTAAGDPTVPRVTRNIAENTNASFGNLTSLPTSGSEASTVAIATICSQSYLDGKIPHSLTPGSKIANSSDLSANSASSWASSGARVELGFPVMKLLAFLVPSVMILFVQV